MIEFGMPECLLLCLFQPDRRPVADFRRRCIDRSSHVPAQGEARVGAGSGLAAGDSVFQAVRDQLAAYFGGELRDFELPLRMAGTPFQHQVWEGLRAIPYGETVSYAELARRIGRPGASRAVGSANGRNPIAIVVPCHRVIAADGTLGGYGGGLDRKEWLLEHRSGRARVGERDTPRAAPRCDVSRGRISSYEGCDADTFQ